MTTAVTIDLNPDLTAHAGRYLREIMRQHPDVEAVALCSLNAKVIWASSPAFEKLAPSIGRIGIASLRLWAKVRSGRVQRVGLVTTDGSMVEIVFVPPLASLLVVSKKTTNESWPDGEPAGIMAALGLR